MFITLRCISFLFALLSLSCLRFLGRSIGNIAYAIHAPRRNIALYNLRMVFPHYSSKQRKKIARESFQNLGIVCFETCWYFSRKEEIANSIILKTTDEIFVRLKKKEGVIFFGGHQSNWEIIFLAGTRIFPGIAIAKSFRHSRKAYHFLTQYRQMYGGRIVSQKFGIRECILALKKGETVFLVDHSFRRSSSYAYPLFGVSASTCLTPALLAYKTNNPLVVVTNKRTEQGYEATFSPMLFPILNNSIKQEVPRLMDHAMRIMEDGIIESPGEWMWMHNRWKIPKKEFKY